MTGRVRLAIALGQLMLSIGDPYPAGGRWSVAGKIGFVESGGLVLYDKAPPGTPTNRRPPLVGLPLGDMLEALLDGAI